MLASFALLLALIAVLMTLQTRLARVQRLLVFYDACISRVEGTAVPFERTGDEASEGIAAGHLYCFDLDITGQRSLFSHLAQVRSSIGERGLARYLLLRTTYVESVARQQSVQELAPQSALREKVALLGGSSFQKLSATFFDGWTSDAPPAFHPVFRYALAATALVNASMVVLGLLHVRQWSDLWLDLLAVSAIQGAIALLIRTRVLPLLEGGARLRGQVKLLAEGLALLNATPFAHPKLLALQRAAQEPIDAVRALQKLDGSLRILEQREKELFFVFSLLFAAGCQAAISIALWKRRHAASMRLWLDAWGEFEALNALATYAFEHPADGQHTVWPELLPPTATPVFEARQLSHPLIPNAVANNIRLGPALPDTREPPTDSFLLISGSNMAGKSTLMRSIGVAAVMAYAGAPVRAASLRLSPLAIGASIALTDSLAEGKSKFLAEVERLAAVVEASKSAPVLFLVDEIFSGTNSLDRHTAAAAVLQRLLANGAIGALSTHDLALTSLAGEKTGGVNVHMASPDPEDPLAFDYLLKPGVNRQTNALAIIRMLGLST